MDYILILERDNSAHEMYLNYCQWTHNEAEMAKLIKNIKMVKDEHAQTLGPDTSTFFVSEGLIPEVVVDGLMALEFSNGAPNPFYKYEGIFTCPSFLVKDPIFDDEPYERHRDHEHYYDSDDSDDSDSTEYRKPLPKRKNSDDMDLDEEPEEVDAFECAHRLSHYFSRDQFGNHFAKLEVIPAVPEA
jgi:hypothetical protein